MSLNRNYKIVLLVAATLFIVPPFIGCTPSMNANYGPVLGKAGKPTRNQKRFTILSDFDQKDTMHAVKKALGMNGLAPEALTATMLSGSHDYEPNPYTRCQCSFAFYLKPSGADGTEVVMLIDDHSWISSRGDAQLANKLISTINTVLASYE